MSSGRQRQRDDGAAGLQAGRVQADSPTAEGYNRVVTTRRVLSIGLILIVGAAARLAADNWPQWRGPLLNGLSHETNLPVRWSKTQGLAWKLPLPAWSGSTPIVWGDRIFLNVADGASTFLWCVNRADGTVRWKR